MVQGSPGGQGLTVAAGKEARQSRRRIVEGHCKFDDSMM